MSAIRKATTREELSCHCRRRTRGAELTLELIEELLLQLSSPFATDSSGKPVLNDKVVIICMGIRKEAHEVHTGSRCDILYTVTGHINKGGVELLLFR